MKLTRAEREHIRKALADYYDIVSTYPEVVTDRQEDQLMIAVEIITNVNED
jgi:hypothetical protein